MTNISPPTPATPQPEPENNLDKFFRLSKRISPYIWAVVVAVVLIPAIGSWFIVQAFSEDLPQPPATEVLATDLPQSGSKAALQTFEPDWTKFESLAKDKLRNARVKTDAFARNELDQWTDDLTQRLDNSFLDWYFGYFHQKQLEYKSFFAGVSGKFWQWLDPYNPSPNEKIAEEITAEFQEEFAKRVLVPRISEYQLQNIAVRTAKEYIKQLGQEFNQVPIESGVSAAEWNRYLEDVSVSIPGVLGNPLDLPLKQITLAGAYVAFKPLISPFIPKVGSAVVAKLATKAGAKIATKTGGMLAAKLGSTLLDAGVGASIIIWDVWDAYNTANIEKPILRKNLVDYLGKVEESILENPDNGVMTVVDKIDQRILQSIHITRDLNASFSAPNA
ncbi:hypothetical protein [Nodosilinea sp. E11]|uniref:hypothetical protein n=1 Tax=Nodosilinea sp. E11 TaxID=3037479 RepID=UPI002934CCF7|nr:hypothetical protein [Nodosilinea sp. E11]WOD37211.1 hypothetical protein RRF56_01765 [Nodosilinea sp. E11]